MPARTAAGASGVQPCPSPARLAPGRLSRAFLDLGAVLTAPGCARAWTREILREWGVSDLADAAELVASELVTNSVHACLALDRAVIRLVLTLDQSELAVLVRDGHPGVPVAAQPGEDDEGGRGLLIVEHLSDRFGWYLLEDGKPAKVTWAVISGSDPAADELPRERTPGDLPDAGLVVPARRPAPALPTRHHQTPSLTTGMTAPRPVDPAILARVKAALERL